MFLFLFLTGCAATDYSHYATMRTAIATAKSQADAARYTAMSQIAQSGDTTAKVAAMMAMMGLQAGSQQAEPVIAPRSWADETRDWLAILLPSAVSAFGIHTSGLVAMNASDNARATAIDTSTAFVSMGNAIKLPAANVTTTNNDNHTINNSYNPTSDGATP